MVCSATQGKVPYVWPAREPISFVALGGLIRTQASTVGCILQSRPSGPRESGSSKMLESMKVGAESGKEVAMKSKSSHDGA